MNDIDLIKSQVEELESFKEKLERQQLTYPLDPSSKDALFVDVLLPTGFTIVPPGLLSPLDFSAEISFDGSLFLLMTTAPY